MPFASIRSTGSARHMAPDAPCRAAGLAACVATLGVVSAAGSQGEINTERERRPNAGRDWAGPGVAGAGAGAVAPGQTADGVRAADDAMRAANPGLFETALRYFPGAAPASGAKRIF